MKFNKNIKNQNKRCIMIKRSIEVDDTLKKFIFMNSNYRRKVWNDFVEEYYRCKECGEYFKPLDYRKEYFHKIETPNKAYENYTIGISKQVAKDVLDGLKICSTNNGRLKYRKFDRFRCSFKVYAMPTNRKLVDNKPDSFNSRVYIDSDDQISFRVRAHEYINIKLKEPLFHRVWTIDYTPYYITKNYQYKFSNYDIKEISFIHELGKFYIQLTVEVENIYSKKNEVTKRKNIGGIDLGIHNPVYVVDDDIKYVEKMSHKELSRIDYLERRIKRLQNILKRKTYGSKNYYKVLRKFRVSHYKIRNIRLNWRRKLAKEIATRYKKICVDRYFIPGKKEHIELPSHAIKRLNHYNRLHGMWLFGEALIHASYKYKTKYYNSPEFTTRTCSKCGHINNKLVISERRLNCCNCGHNIDRDENAAINCYFFLLNKEIAI